MSVAQAMVTATGKLKDVYEKALKTGDAFLDQFIAKIDEVMKG